MRQTIDNATLRRLSSGRLISASLCCALVVMTLAGCSPADSAGAAATGGQAQITEELFVNGVGLLNELDRYNPNEALPQILGRLNQWLALQKPIEGWKPDPLVATLPQPYRALPALNDLERLRFDREDGLLLMEAVWLRDVARVAVGRELDAVARAGRLFDWTVRNLELESESDRAKGAAPLRPWENLLFGRATAAERAWVFILLARQQGLDAMILARSDEVGGAEGMPKAWLAAVLVGQELYLFDPLYGLAVGWPDKKPATLDRVAEEAKTFEAWRIGDQAYRYRASDFGKVEALLEASPFYLAERSNLMELDLAGESRLALSTDPSELAARVKQCKHVAGARLWAMPYARELAKAQPGAKARDESIRRLAPFLEPNHRLWQARVLQLMGRYTGDEGANHAYEQCRPPESELKQAKAAKKLRADIEHDLVVAKQDASYWLGQVAYERGRLDIAIDYFQHRVLDDDPQSPWRNAAQYELGRAYEALGQPALARKALEETHGPQRPGNLLRARLLSAK